MRRSLAAAASIACIAILGWAALAGADSPGAPVPYAIPTGSTGPTGATGLTSGPDGNPWFVETNHDSNNVYHVGTVSSGKVVEYSTSTIIPESTAPPPLPAPTAITAGVAATKSAGVLWFTVLAGDYGGLESITPSGVVTAVTHSGLLYRTSAIAGDSLGNLWVARGVGGNAIDELAPPYTVVTPAADLPENANPESIVEGPDGVTMWFTEPGSGGDEIGSVDQNGDVTQHPVGVVGTLGNIVVGPDGNLWTGSAGSGPNPSAVLRVTPQGAVTAFDLPDGSNANPDLIAAGPDGRLWMPDNAGTDGGLTSVTTAGVFANYPAIVPTADTIASILKDPGGADALFVIDRTASTVDRVPLTPPLAPPPPTTGAAPVTPPALTAALTPVSAVTLAGAVLSGTIAEPIGSAATAVSYHFEYGTSTAYGLQTPSSAATATSSGVAVSAPLSGLAPYTTYHYRLVASDCGSAICETATPDQTFTTGSTLAPVRGTTVGATVAAGDVLIKLPGKHHFVSLAAGELVPLGATFDARHGTVLVQSGIGHGEVASGLFAGGVFVVTQPGRGTATVLVLASSFKACVSKPQAHAAAAPARKQRPKSKKVVNQVFGNAHGQFSTRGHYATAADQGTRWKVADRCDGTLVAVSAGKVKLTDLVRHRSLILTAGHQYLVRGR